MEMHAEETGKSGITLRKQLATESDWCFYMLNWGNTFQAVFLNQRETTYKLGSK
jgi:hypothetical protein